MNDITIKARVRGATYEATKKFLFTKLAYNKPYKIETLIKQGQKNIFIDVIKHIIDTQDHPDYLYLEMDKNFETIIIKQDHFLTKKINYYGTRNEHQRNLPAHLQGKDNQESGSDNGGSDRESE